MAKAGRRRLMWVRVLSALALFLSFSDQPAFAARQITPAMAAAYVLPDGTIGDICYGSDGVEDHNSSQEGLAPVCDYCRLAASVILPSPPGDSYLAHGVATSAENTAEFRTLFVDYPRALPQSRAPPLLL